MSNYSRGNLQPKERNTSWAKIFDYTLDNSTVLDVGCSDGIFGKELKNKKQCKVYGIEIDLGDFQQAKKVLDEVYDFNIELQPIPTGLKKIKFDEIILADVIEHFVDPINALIKLKDLLIDGGKVVFSIPNMAHISVRLQLLSGKFSYNETGLLDKTHLHFYDFDEVKRVFQEAGFQIENIDSNTLPYPPSFLEKKLRGLGLQDAGFIKNIQDDNLAQTFQFVGIAIPIKNNKQLNPISLSTSTPEYELVKYIENLKESTDKLTKDNAQLIGQISILELEKKKLEIRTIKSPIDRTLGFNKIIRTTLPDGSKRRILAGRLKKRFFSDNTYNRWIKRCEPFLFSAVTENIKNITSKPLISIVVPCYNTPRRYIDELIQSVSSQVYGKWQLCLVDGSTEDKASIYIKQLSQKDPRITYIKVGENLGIVGNTNLGLKASKGSFIAFLDHDDTLSPFALAEVVIALNENTKIDLFYSDEDKLSDNGKNRLIPFFKPDWSPELLLGVNYITHFLVVRKSLVDRVGGLRKGFDGAQDYDFLLRITEFTKNIKHIPKILYHWRLAEGSTSKNVLEKNYADSAGRRALADAAKRRGNIAEVVELPKQPTNYRLKYALPRLQPKVSIIIPFNDKPDLLRQCIGSILNKTTYDNYELILVSNNSTEPATLKYLNELKKAEHCKIYYWDNPFNYSKINNFGRKKASGEYLILLNNDTKVITPEWINELIGVASQPEIGAVGALLYYPNKTIQHAGVIIGMGGMAGHVFRRRNPDEWTDFGKAVWPRNYLAVTGACLAIKASKYDEVGGLDETFTIAGNDVALGISLYEKGYRNVYWPFAELIHYESESVGSYNNVPQLDYDHSLDYYRPYLKWEDPYFNYNLDLMNEQVRLRSEYDQLSQ